MSKTINLKGKKFGKLTVIEKAPTRISKSGQYIPYWYCVCDCQNNIPEDKREIITVQGRKLRDGHTLSCGCIKRTCLKKSNRYEIIGNVAKLYDSKGVSFFIDVDDLEKVEQFCWHVNKRGYVQSTTPMANGKRNYISLHRLVTNCTDLSKVVDHINHNTLDNRKNNLRICTPSQNQQNVRPSSYNKSGVRGVRFNKEMNKWEVGISIDGKHRVVGYYKEIADAITCRRQYEEKYFGDYRYKGD